METFICHFDGSVEVTDSPALGNIIIKFLAVEPTRLGLIHPTVEVTLDLILG